MEKKGIAHNTLIIFTSDNGPHREGGNDPAYFKSAGIFRGIKRDLYEGGIREPFIAYWPGKVSQGRPRMFVHYGICIQPFWNLPELKVQIKQMVFLAYQRCCIHENKPNIHISIGISSDDGRQAVRWNDWKGVRLKVNKNADAPIELYNLANDPSETKNVSADHPEIVKKIKEFIAEAHVQNPAWPLLPGEFKKH